MQDTIGTFPVHNTVIDKPCGFIYIFQIALFFRFLT